MKHKLRIGEFAKLKNVTTEALRHYDRVDLLKPVETDSETGYRYYSVFQSGKLATIIELKALGFSIEEMKIFFNNKQLQQTHDLLSDKHVDLVKRIKEMKRLEKSLSKKIRNLADAMDLEAGGKYIIRKEAARTVAFMETIIKDMVSFEWTASDLENQLINIHPVVGTDSYGLIVSKDAFMKGSVLGESNLIYFIEESVGIDKELLRSFPERTVACFTSRGPLKTLHQTIEDMLNCLADDGYRVVGDVIIKFRISGTLTEVASEQLYEFQIPIESQEETG